MNYQQTLDYIYSFTDYEVKPQNRYSPEEMDPTRPARLLELLGNPHLDYPTIHIAGTKGKGSVAAICASIMQAAGLSTGLYTSPHLQEFNERIQIDGVPISHDDLSEMVETIRLSVAQIEGITTFEVITALAFSYFSRRKVDVAIIEVGLGGRLDATNVIHPMVSIITSLSYDHTYLLGNTLAEIAAEKGGIIKPDVPVISASQKDEASIVLERIARERHAPLTMVGRDWWYEMNGCRMNGQTLLAGQVHQPGELYDVSLLGAHQALNATVALAALEIVRQKAIFPTLDQEAIKKGLEHVKWPGRFQIMNQRPYLVLDGAHNVDAVDKLKTTLLSYFPDRRIIIIFGVAVDKDVDNMIKTLLPAAGTIIATAAEHPRAIKPAVLVDLIEKNGFGAISAENVADALEMAWQMAGPDDVICATGSLFIVGDALTAWSKWVESGIYQRQTEDLPS